MSPSQEDARELLRAIAQEQDRSAFAALFAFFFPRVKAFLMRGGAAEAVAEELAQETLLRVWRNAGFYDPACGAVSTWIFVIARNLRIDRLRGERAPNDAAFDPSDAQEPPSTGECLMIQSERSDRVRAAMSRLSQEQAAIVRLYFFEERPHSEIARALGLPLGTVKSRIRLAIERLRAHLDDLA